MYNCLLAAIPVLLLVTLARSLDFVQQGAETRLFGSSFGILGVNTTFDYVVRSLHANRLVLFISC